MVVATKLTVSAMNNQHEYASYSDRARARARGRLIRIADTVNFVAQPLRRPCYTKVIARPLLPAIGSGTRLAGVRTYIFISAQQSTSLRVVY